MLAVAALATTQTRAALDVAAVPAKRGFLVTRQDFENAVSTCKAMALPASQNTLVSGVCLRNADLTSFRVMVEEHEPGSSLEVAWQTFADSSCLDMVSSATPAAYPVETDLARGEIDTGLDWSGAWLGNESLTAYEYSACGGSGSDDTYEFYLRVVAVVEEGAATGVQAGVEQTTAEVARVIDETAGCAATGLPWASWIATTTGTPSWYEVDEETVCFNSPDAGAAYGWSLRATCDPTTGSDAPVAVDFYEFANCQSSFTAPAEANPYVLPGDCGGTVYRVSSLNAQPSIDLRIRCGTAGRDGNGGDSTTGGGSNENTTTTVINTGTNGAKGPAPGVWVGVVPTILLLSAVVYVLLTQKKKKKDVDSEDDLEASLPPGAKTSRAGRVKMLGYTLSVMRVKLPDENDEEDPHSDSDDDVEDDVVAQALRRGGAEIRDASELEFGRLIGRGGTGKVFEGKFRGSRVAIKEFLGGRTHSSFLREVRNLRKLHHPNIIRLYGAVDSDLHRLVIMEYAPHSLADVIALDGLPPEQRPSALTLLQWSQQLASGLAFLHGKGLIHFDVKPENVLLDEAWNVKICDFGVSRNSASVLRAPSTNDQEGGTVAYTSPEMITGERGQLSAKVDVYAYGILFWQLFHHGAEPHPDEWSVLDILTNVSMNEYRPDIDPDVPGPLVYIITTCWDTDPAKRLSMDDIGSALHEILGSRSVDIAGQGSFNDNAVFELGQQVFVFDQLNQCWLPGCPAKLKSNRLKKPPRSYRVLGSTFAEDNLLLAD